MLLHRSTRSRPPTRAPLPRAFWVLFYGTLVNRIGTFVEPFLVLYLTSQRGATVSQAGLVLTAFGLGAFGSQILGGWFTDHFGRRITLTGGMLASAVSLALLGYARGLVLITVAAVLVGLAGDLYRPASAALVADVVDPERRPRAYGLLYWAVNLGFSVASITAGFLAQRGYGLLFAVDAATCAAYGLVVWFGIRRDPPRVSAYEAGGPSGYGIVLRDRLMVVITFFAFLHGNLYMQSFVTLPLAIGDSGLGPSGYGKAIAVNGILIVALQPFAARWLERFDRITVLAIGQVILGAGFALTALADATLTYALTVAVWTVGEIMMAGFLPSIVSDLAPAHARGRYQAFVGTAFGAAALTAPALGTLIYGHASPTLLWIGCLWVGLACAVGFMLLRPAVIARQKLSAPRSASPATTTS